MATARVVDRTTYRLLGSLVDQGFVSYLPEEKRYGLAVAGARFELPRRCRCAVAQPVLTRLVTATKENAHLAVLHGPDVYHVIASGPPARAGDRRRVRPRPP